MKYVSDLDLWLKTKEKSLKNIEKTNRAENLKKCKELNVELISQRENVETAKEHLNQLIRQFHSSENIQNLISSVTDLVKSYESVCRYSATVLNKLESNLESNFGSIQEKFFIWKKQASDIITSCQDVPGESHDIAQNIANLNGLKEDFERVEGWLDELETNFGNQFGGSTNQKMETSISKHRNEYNGIVREVNHFHQVMTDAEAYVKALESSRLELHVWLEDFSKRLASAGPIEEPAEASQKLEVFEASWKEFKAKSPAFENLQKQAFEIGDGDLGTVPGRKIQITLQLHSSCEKKIQDSIRLYENLTKQNRTYLSTKAELRQWMKVLDERVKNLEKDLDAVETTVDAQEILTQVEQMLIEKQEGEVKVHVTLGKAEKIASSVSSTGRIKLHEEMDIMKDAFEELVNKLHSVRSKAEVILSELQSISKSCIEIESMLNDIKSLLNEETHLSNDFKEKKQTVERLSDLLNDTTEIEDKLFETNKRILDTGQGFMNVF